MKQVLFIMAILACTVTWRYRSLFTTKPVTSNHEEAYAPQPSPIKKVERESEMRKVSHNKPVSKPNRTDTITVNISKDEYFMPGIAESEFRYEKDSELNRETVDVGLTEEDIARIERRVFHVPGQKLRQPASAIHDDNH